MPAGFATAAFKLTADEPFAGPIVTEKAVYVIGLRKVIPSEIPAFDSIRAKVEADYQLLTALQLARSSGTNFAQTVATAATGKTFADLCAEAKLTPAKLPAFSLASRSLPEVENHISFGRVQEIAYGMPAGSSTGFVPTSEGGLILHILARTPVSDAAIKADQSAFLAQVRQTRQGEAFNAWFNREAQTALRDTPLSRPATIGAKP